MPTKHHLRIIAGSLKGRKLVSPDWDGLRPTSDRLRETLFNVLSGHIAGARMLDAYAGTGAVGMEAISRGAAHVTFLERDARAIDLITGNLARCGVRDGYTVLRADAMKTGQSALAGGFDLVFVDPPYALAPDAAASMVAGVVAQGGRLVLEHARRTAAPERLGDLTCTRTLTSGDSALSFYTHESRDDEPA
jgi:16S rRNA (guanine(966)-N(2))-methyltransferase RsmD